jgi:hypothetical protein
VSMMHGHFITYSSGQKKQVDLEQFNVDDYYRRILLSNGCPKESNTFRRYRFSQCLLGAVVGLLFLHRRAKIADKAPKAAPNSEHGALRRCSRSVGLPLCLNRRHPLFAPSQSPYSTFFTVIKHET